MQFRVNKDLELDIVKAITEMANTHLNDKEVIFMEVCGTHTVSICRYGIRSILPKNVKLISGPGCPVCVTPAQYIDQTIKISKNEKVIICSFGDIIRVPGISGTLETARSQGADIRIVYSPLDCLKIARQNPDKIVIFLAIGFETTSPIVGLAIKKAENERIDNFMILSGLKLLFPALKALLNLGEVRVNGLICPGHVSAVTGEKPYEFIPRDFGIPCVITGFEPLDILIGIYMLLIQVVENKARVENEYKRVVTRNGNSQAMNIIKEVFQKVDDSWRGLGVIPDSGLELVKLYNHRNARSYFGLEKPIWTGDGICRCGDVVKGLKAPYECPLFGVKCTPQTPVGPCMVSSEGSCAAYYKYKKVIGRGWDS